MWRDTASGFHFKRQAERYSLLTLIMDDGKIDLGFLDYFVSMIYLEQRRTDISAGENLR